ncbi:hypothetical protein VTK26DRAFT_4431 [Humicola hyalothermophila]
MKTHAHRVLPRGLYTPRILPRWGVESNWERFMDDGRKDTGNGIYQILGTSPGRAILRDPQYAQLWLPPHKAMVTSSCSLFHYHLSSYLSPQRSSIHTPLF